MNREAVALGTPVYTTFSRAHGRCRREADRRGQAAGSGRSGRSWPWRSARRPAPAGAPRPRSAGPGCPRGRRVASTLRPSASGPHRGPTKWHRQPTPSSPSSSPPRSPGCWSRRPSGSPGGSGRSTIPNDRSLHDCPDPEALGPGDPRRGRGRRLDLASRPTASRARSCSGRLAIALVGVLDDIYDLPALPKLARADRSRRRSRCWAASGWTRSPCRSSAASSWDGSPTRGPCWRSWRSSTSPTSSTASTASPPASARSRRWRWRSSPSRSTATPPACWPRSPPAARSASCATASRRRRASWATPARTCSATCWRPPRSRAR